MQKTLEEQHSDHDVRFCGLSRLPMSPHFHDCVYSHLRVALRRVIWWLCEICPIALCKGMLYIHLGFPGGSDGKASAYNAGDQGLIPGLGRFPWRRKWQPTPVPLPGKFHGLRSLVGYSPWCRRELDMTERLHFTSSVCSRALTKLLPCPNPPVLI